MIKKILNFLLNFILSVLVLVGISLNLVSNTIFNKDYIKQKLKENNFYSRAYSDIKDSFENYTMQSGLNLEILDNLITEEMVTDDINSKVDSIFNGNKVSIDTNLIRTELDARINHALEENNRVPSDSEKESIKKYEDAIVDSYQSGILYGKDFAIETVFLEKAKIMDIASIVLISIILLIMNKSILKYMSFVGINLLFSGILCASIKYLLEKRIEHILILDAKFSNFLVNTLTEIIGEFYKLGIMIVIIGILFIIIGSLKNLRKTIENTND